MRHLAIGTLLACAVAAGCGGRGGGDRLSRTELITRADAICAKYEAKLDALGEPANVDELKSFADRALPIAKEGREELHALRPPEELEDAYDAWLDEGDEAIEIVERLRDAADDDDLAEIQRIAEDARRANTESNRLAAELGFEQCGDTASPAS